MNKSCNFLKYDLFICIHINQIIQSDSRKIDTNYTDEIKKIRADLRLNTSALEGFLSRGFAVVYWAGRLFIQYSPVIYLQLHKYRYVLGACASSRFLSKRRTNNGHKLRAVFSQNPFSRLFSANAIIMADHELNLMTGFV